MLDSAPLIDPYNPGASQKVRSASSFGRCQRGEETELKLTDGGVSGNYPTAVGCYKAVRRRDRGELLSLLDAADTDSF